MYKKIYFAKRNEHTVPVYYNCLSIGKRGEGSSYYSMRKKCVASQLFLIDGSVEVKRAWL